MSRTTTKPPIFFVYILKSTVDNNYYTGLTARGLEERLKEHNRSCASTASTKGRKGFRLVYYEIHKSLKEARTREKFWKSGYGRELRNRCFNE